MSGHNYPQQPHEQQPHYQPPHAYPVEKKGIETFFIAKDKIGLFLFLCAGMVVVGFLLINLMASGLVDFEDAIMFLGFMAVDLGVIVLITLVMVSGICREDLPEKTRNWMILVSGILLVVYIIVYVERSTMMSMMPFF
ncbi:MAG: hypothetical protein Q7J68_00485 [Thermoplasmata archaeon]|nr:hypothetical protein [Thermoplasmata archaeon]